eukprot:169316-Rhodomonas_salina.2
MTASQPTTTNVSDSFTAGDKRCALSEAHGVEKEGEARERELPRIPHREGMGSESRGACAVLSERGRGRGEER